MKITHQTIASLLRQVDIEGYISLGAPADEYDSEAEALARSFAEMDDDEATVENITAIVTEAWKQSFNLEESDLGKRQLEIRNFAETIVKLHSAAT
jgi:hypothetical protein